VKQATAALKSLVDANFFGKDEAVLVLRSDQSNREIVEAARVLNRPAIVKRIEAAFPLAEPTGKPLLFPGKPAYSIDSLALSGDRKTLVAAGWFGGSALYRYDLRKKRPVLVPVKTPKVAYRAIALSDDGATLYAMTEKELLENDVVIGKAKDFAGLRVVDGKLRMIDEGRARAAHDGITAAGTYDPKKPIVIREGRKTTKLGPRGRGGVTGLAFSPSGTRLAATNEDGFVRVWNWRQNELLLEVRGRQESMNAVVFLAEDRIAAAGRDVATGPPVYAWKIQ
jgi:hypothetical protein